MPSERAADVDATREFFADRAATWDDRFPDDLPAFATAVAELGLQPGDTVLDAGCGSGRALAALRHAVGPAGTVVGLDLTAEMLASARDRSRERVGALVLGDARTIALRTESVDAVFAAGLLPHLPDPVAALTELHRISRPAARLAVFHPVGRASLAARHGRKLRPDELLDPRVVPAVLEEAGWRAALIDDADDRYLALATRRS